VTLTRQIAQPAAAPPAAAPAAPAGRGARESSAQTEQPGGGGAAAAMCLEGVTAADAPAADGPAADAPEQPVAGVPAAGVPAADAPAMRQGVAATPLAMPLAMTHKADVAPIPATPTAQGQPADQGQPPRTALEQQSIAAAASSGSSGSSVAAEASGPNTRGARASCTLAAPRNATTSAGVGIGLAQRLRAHCVLVCDVRNVHLSCTVC
jgi:hypothetical protein